MLNEIQIPNLNVDGIIPWGWSSALNWAQTFISLDFSTAV